MNKRAFTVATALVSLGLGGCASAPPPARVDTSQHCFQDLRQLPVFPLSYLPEKDAKKARAKDYAEYARCLQTASGMKLPTALFRLDGVTPPSSVKVTLTASKHGVLAASAALLDANFKEVSHVGFDAFENRGSTYSADVFINSTDVRYVTVSPDTSQVGKSEKQLSSLDSSTVIPAGLVYWIYHSSYEVSEKRIFTDAGSLLVTVNPAINPAPRGKE